MTTTTETRAGLEPGWYPGLSMPAYLTLDAMSASGIERLRRSPLHFRHWKDTPSEETDAMRLGTALHTALLEPELFRGRYVRGIEGDGRTKAVKDARAALAEEFPGATILTPQQWDDLTGMRDAVMAHPRARSFFEGEGDNELTGVWLDPITGVACKMRLDRDVPRAAVIVDLKSTRDASPHAFARQCANLGYHRKSAFYRRGCAALDRPRNGSALIAVESSPPYAVAVYLLDEGDLDRADTEIARHLNVYADCLDRDEWPGYGSEMTSLPMPGWATEGNDDE